MDDCIGLAHLPHTELMRSETSCQLNQCRVRIHVDRVNMKWHSMSTESMRRCKGILTQWCHKWLRCREYELMTEAHAKLSVVRNCSRSSLPVCSGGGETAGGRGVVSSNRGWGEADSTQGDRIWSTLVRQKVECGLLLLIHILCLDVSVTAWIWLLSGVKCWNHTA